MRPHAVIRKSSLLAGRTTRNNTVSPDLSTLCIACNWTWRQQTSDFARLYSQNNAHRPSTEPQIQCDPPIKPLGGSPRGNGDCSTRTEKHDNTYSIPNFGPNIPRGGGGGGGSLTSSPLMDAALTTFVGVGLLFVGGIAYVEWYKQNVLDKMEQAFAAGYDPALEVASHGKTQSQDDEDNDLDLDELAPGSGDGKEHQVTWTGDLRRREQDWIDRIVHGKEAGRYFVLLGPKGTGKTTMIIHSMQVNQAEGVAMCDVHPDLEVFRLRLGRALNYEYNEDSQTGLFQRRDPREGGPALDIERALNKLEKVALRSARRTSRPLVLIMNNIHYFKNNDEGQNMLLQLQQRAESWAASGEYVRWYLARGFLFDSHLPGCWTNGVKDDFWPYHLFQKTASRMHVLSIYDLSRREASYALRRMHRGHKHPLRSTSSMINEAVSVVGGRLLCLARVAKASDVIEMANRMLNMEKAWFLSQIGLIPDCDDDVLDEQKWSTCSSLLLREFVKIRKEREREWEEAGGDTSAEPLQLPTIPYWRCRQIMTRPDFLEELDRRNIITIDIYHDVRPDSMLILHAARQVVEEEGFDEVLDSVRDRVDEIESLHRTRELTFKDVGRGDRIKLSVDKCGSMLIES